MLNKNKKFLLISLGLLVVTAFILYLVNLSKQRQETRSQAARNVGEMSMEPESLTTPVAVDGNFNVGAVVNVGTVNHLNIASINITFDPVKLEVAQCTPGSGYQGIAGGNPCDFDNTAGTIKIRTQTINTTGQTGAPILANINFHALSEGTAAVLPVVNQIVVQDDTGASSNFDVSATYPGSYTIGTVAITSPVPTSPAPTNPSPTSCTSPSAPVWVGTGITRVVADANNDKVTLDWNDVAGANEYWVEWSYDGADWHQPADLATSSTWEGVFPPTTIVWFRVQSGNSCGKSSFLTVNSQPIPNRPTPPSSNVSLNFKIRFQGVLSQRADQKVKLTVIGGPGSIEQVFNDVNVTSDNLGIFSGTVSLPTVSAGGGYILLIKGPYHLARKYCDAVPTVDSETTDYHCGSIGRINLVNGANTLDFSNTLIYVGDLPPQDGVMNARDGAEMRLNLTKTDVDALSRADVNFDGIVNTTDYSLLIQSMQVRYDEER